MQKSPEQLKLEQSQARTKQALARIEGTLEQTINTSNEINKALYSDHQKMTKIYNHLNETDLNLQQGNYIANGMLSFWTRIKNKLTGGFRGKKDEDLPGPINYQNKKEEGRQQKRQIDEGQKKQSIDDTLNYLNDRMENLKVAATITGSTLDEQKHLLDAIHGKTDKNMNNLAELNKKAKKLLDK